MKNKIIAVFLSAVMACACFTGCGSDAEKGSGEETSEKKVFNYGTMAYGVAMEDAGLNPHENYSGWSAVRYGVGETLFRFNEKMEPEPWLAESYEQVDENTVRITLKDGIKFSSGRDLDGQAVKECLEDLVAVHDRAPGNLNIKEILADGQDVTIVSDKKSPAMINYLSDPYAAIIDMEAGVTEDKNVSGTGPFVASEVSDTEITLKKNENYWGGDVKMDEIHVRQIPDGDTLTMALQSGEIDAAQSIPYTSLPIFAEDSAFRISSTDTSRVSFAQINFESPVMQDINVRKAVAMGINKEGFTTNLLDGNGTPADCPFPSNFAFGNDTVTVPEYDQEGAKALLEESGWKDSDGDGYVDQNGENLEISWLTYPGRKEIGLLAESVQASLKEIGIKVNINSTENTQDFLDTNDWDIYASSFVAAPTGDPAYFFETHCLKDSAKNRGHYYNENLENLAQELGDEFDKDKRAELATAMEQTILDDYGFIFVSHLKMSIVTETDVTGLEAHPSDYYEFTKDLDFK